MNAYARLEEIFARHDALEGAAGILGWDARTTMPPGAAETRGEQLAALKAAGHALLTADRTLDLVEEAGEIPDLDAWQRANLVEMRRVRAHAAAVPADLVEANERATNLAQMAWREARATSDFGIFLPHLREVLALQVRKGEAVGAALGLGVYDALLDGYDPGMRSERIDAIFAVASAAIPGLIGAALEAQGKPPARIEGHFAIEAQRRLSLALMERLGFDFRRGRLDVSLHPFCGGAVDDVRITTRYRETDFLDGLMGTLHETGHALYEQGLPLEWRRQPVGKARGMTLHESQSLSIEMQACRGRAFAEFLSPMLRGHFGDAFSGTGPGAVHRLLARVEPGLIRVDADEISYPAHVLLRYDLECALVSGDLAPDDLPGAFDDGMRELLGLRVPNDALGCLQDIHWSSGAFGYFPTYTLGAMAAAQLCEAARSALPSLDASLARGEFGPLVGWLRANVHAKASLLDTDGILKEATGSPLAPESYLRHLRRRYVEERAD